MLLSLLMSSIITMPNKDDIDWINHLKQNDSDATTQLWEALYRDSIKIARQYNQLDDIGYSAALITYEIIMEKGIYNFKFKSRFRSYCWLILSNELKRLMKKNPDFDILEDNKFVGDIGVSLQASAETMLKRLLPCLNKLTEKRRMAIILVYLHELPYEEAAKKLGIKRNTLDKRLSNARKDLKKCLQSHGFLTREEVTSL